MYYPDKVDNFRKWLTDKLKIKYDFEKEKKFHKSFGIIFIIISIVLFIYSIV